KYSTVAISPDGLRVAGSQGGTVFLWDALTGAKLAQAPDEKHQRVLCLAFGPDGKRLACGTAAGQIVVRDALSLDTLLSLEDPEGPVQPLTFSPDGARLAAGMKSGRVRVYESTPSAPRRALARRAAALSDQARTLDDDLFARRFFLADVLKELEAQSGLSQEL